LALCLSAIFERSLCANPTGPTVRQGQATFTSQGPQLTIQTSSRAYINWQSFNIGLGQTTTFVQPSSSSVVWNHIDDSNPSQILGNLNANGYVILQNQSGFYIGGQAVINTHGLLLTTAPFPMPDLSSRGAWDFNSLPPTAPIINYGQINVGRGGSAFLIAHDIENHGAISAPEGNIGLYAGREVLMSDRPDGRGLSAKVTLPEGSVDNSGRLIADAGTIAMRAQVVNQGGLVQANSVRNVNGTIELVASDSLTLGPNSTIEAKGDAGISSGGSVSIKSDNRFVDAPGSSINISGGSRGGNGGEVEISANQMGAINSTIGGHANSGFVDGKLLIDPQNIFLAASGDNAPGSGVINAGDSPDTLTLNVNSFSSSLSQITLQAANNIELSTVWRLADRLDTSCTLTLEAGNNITFDESSGINAGKNWSVNLFAGTSATARNSGNDSIFLLGNSFIQTQNGNIGLHAGNDILVNSGESGGVDNNGIRTLAGGSIEVTATFGDVNAGANPQGYFGYRNQLPYYRVSPNLGGISTAAGGDVTITAGGNVTSLLSLDNADSGIGAFGPQAGNVTINAGGSVFGHYLVANGNGTITAGENAGGADPSQNIALSLVKGSWTVSAGQNIYLQEVRNPNGVFNVAGGSGSPNYHFFDYDPQSSVTLDAGLGVYLIGLNLPRPNDAVPMIFPPTLDITAGSGGVTLQETVILFPSPYQDLSITTTAGGSLQTVANNLGHPELIMSDSSRTRWTAAGNFGDLDHGAVPTELNNPNPVNINIDGNMEDIILMVSKRATINVGGNMDNCSFWGQNLHPGDVTSIDVNGRIYNRSPYSFIILDQSLQGLPSTDRPLHSQANWDDILHAALDPTVLAGVTVPDNLLPSKWADYASSAHLFQTATPLVYDSTTRRFGIGGQMSDFVRAALEGPITVLRYGPDGIPLLDANRHFITDTVQFATPAAIEALYHASQGAPSLDFASGGYVIGGPGQFNVHASSISLGNTYGIVSCGVGDPFGEKLYGNLAPFTPSGATVNVVSDGDLDMITSTIATLGGGDVNVTSLSGSMNLGSQELLNLSRYIALGVYTSGRGDVNVTALGDININGSRIAAYNGGNIHIESLQGSVNAGNGGTSYVPVFVYYVDPVSGKAASVGEQVFGSGILATTLVDPSQVPGSPVLPGNITVETPRGDILASRGGILQDALSGNLSGGPTITLTAGSPGYVGNIDLGDSGVIGGTINLKANGNISGLVISRQNSTINAAQSFSGTVLSGGTANLSAGGTIAGTVIGVGGVQASGGQGITATLLGQSVSVGGGQAQSTLGTTAAATSTSQAAAQTATSDAKQQVTSDTSQDDDQKKGNGPKLVRRVGRVTVILPKSS